MVSAHEGGSITNLCATELLTIVTNGGAVVSLQPGTCTKTVTINKNGEANIYNLCASEQLSIQDNSGTPLTLVSSSCPSVVTINALAGLPNGNQFINVCATQLLTMTISGRVGVVINSAFCPKTTNVSASSGAIVQNLCATEQMSINALDGTQI
ncbi:unnamed protein product [Didymodactylos carnosus]|uniref:Uncharacterized protein n=1 Tax=Didymodactylos carnosus TaxID=1234261 RepID=A0A815ZX96_9BILA|nr:unnamed protein product [Didymodactylos carnosus]CAF4458754.1 unnamed protein product [Didymodactylos carnosus]